MIAANRKSSLGEKTFCCHAKDALVSRIELSFRARGDEETSWLKDDGLLGCPDSFDEGEAPAEDIRVGKSEDWEEEAGGIRLRREIRTKRLSIRSFER
jgi:hypothetical protein